MAIYLYSGTPGRTLRGCVDLNVGFGFWIIIFLQSHPTRVRGFKLLKMQGAIRPLPSRTLRGCVDLNGKVFVEYADEKSRTLRGCVD